MILSASFQQTSGGKLRGILTKTTFPKSISSADMNHFDPLLGFLLLHCWNPPTLHPLLVFLLLHHQNPPTLQLPLAFLLVHYQNPHHHLRFKPQGQEHLNSQFLLALKVYHMSDESAVHLLLQEGPQHPLPSH